MPEFNPEEFLKGSAPAAPAFDPEAFLKGAPAAAPPVDESGNRIAALKDRYKKATEEASGKGGYTDIARDAYTLKLDRPFAGLAAGVGGLFSNPEGSSFGERYQAGVQAENERQKQARDATGWGGTATDVVASVPSLGPKLVARAALGGGRKIIAEGGIPLLSGAGKNAAVAGGEGVVRGAAEGSGEGVGGAVEGAVKEGAADAATAYGVGKVVEKVLPAARRVAATEKQIARGATPEEGKAAAKEFYKEMDKGGIAYAKPQTAMVKKGLDDLVATNQYDPIAHQKISGLFSQLEQKVTQPQGATLTELHNLRSAFAKEARGADASTREAAGKVVGTIDDLVHGSRPAVNPNKLDVITKHKEASQKWRAAALADDIEFREGKAATKLAVSPGTSADTANRAAFKPVLDRANKPGAYNPYTDEQKALLAKIVFGDRGQNIARNVARTADSPITRSIGAGVGGALGFGHGGPFAAGGAAHGANKALQGVGAIADALAARRGQKNIDALLRSISGPSSATHSRSDLAQVLAGQAVTRAAAVPSYVDRLRSK